MKRLILTLIILTGVQQAHAAYIFRNSATNINTGTLPNARLDPSSVTLQGNSFSITGIVSGISASTGAFATGVAASSAAFATGIAASTAALSSGIVASVSGSTGAYAAGVAASSATFSTGIAASTASHASYNSTATWSAAQTFTSATFTNNVTVSSNEFILGDLKFITTYYMTMDFPFAVGNATNAVANSTSGINGLGYLDGGSSTAGLNSSFYKITIPGNFVAGSTPILAGLASVCTGFIDVQESWVLSFSTGTSDKLAISSGIGSATMNYSSSVVINITGQTSINGGERSNKTIQALNGVGMMLGTGNCTLYIRAVRDGTSTNDPSSAGSAIAWGVLAGKFQQ